MPKLAEPADVDAVLTKYEIHMDRSPVSVHTVRSYVKGAEAFLEWLTTKQTKHLLDAVLADDRVSLHAAKDFRSHLLTVEKLAPKTVDARMTGVGSLLVMVGRPRPNIKAAAPKSRPKPKALSRSQEIDVLRAAEARGLRDHAIVRLMLAAGPRIEETVSLDVDDVPTSERLAKVIIRQGKGGTTREVPIEARTAITVLNQWKRERVDHYGLPVDSGPLFVSNRGTRLVDRTLRHMVSRVGVAACVDEIHPHIFRHTFLTRMLENGVDVVTAAALAGHADVKTTMIYTQPDEERARAAVRGLEVDY